MEGKINGKWTLFDYRNFKEDCRSISTKDLGKREIRFLVFQEIDLIY
jgi:hypothetical protein